MRGRGTYTLPPTCDSVAHATEAEAVRADLATGGYWGESPDPRQKIHKTNPIWIVTDYKINAYARFGGVVMQCTILPRMQGDRGPAR